MGSCNYFTRSHNQLVFLHYTGAVLAWCRGTITQKYGEEVPHQINFAVQLNSMKKVPKQMSGKSPRGTHIYMSSTGMCQVKDPPFCPDLYPKTTLFPICAHS